MFYWLKTLGDSTPINRVPEGPYPKDEALQLKAHLLQEAPNLAVGLQPAWEAPFENMIRTRSKSYRFGKPVAVPTSSSTRSARTSTSARTGIPASGSPCTGPAITTTPSGIRLVFQSNTPRRSPKTSCRPSKLASAGPRPGTAGGRPRALNNDGPPPGRPGPLLEGRPGGPPEEPAGDPGTEDGTAVSLHAGPVEAGLRTPPGCPPGPGSPGRPVGHDSGPD